MNMMHKPERCWHGHAAETCTQCRTGSRNHYYRRKLMTAEDFRAEQHYMIGRRRLINRSVYGWGVVDGLSVEHDGKSGKGPRPAPGPHAQEQAGAVKGGPLVIGHGFALDRHGRELLVPDNHCLGRHDLFVAGDAAHHCRPQDLSTLKKGHYLLSAHYAEHRIDPVRLSDACDCFEQEWNRICETVVYSLTPIDKCPRAESACPQHDCGCPPPAKPVPAPKEPPRHNAADAHAQTPADPRAQTPGDAHAQMPADARALTPADARAQVPADHHTDDVAHEPPPRDPSWPRSHHVLCCWSDHAEIGGPGTVCHWRDDIWIDPCEGVPIACVDFIGLECCEPVFGEISECEPRRIVKRNDLLFDLIRGCDLTRIDYLSWLKWGAIEADGTRLVKWEEFYRAIIQDVAAFVGEHPWLKYTTWYQRFDPQRTRERPTRFEIGFSGPVRVASLTPHAVSITGIFPDQDTGWNKPLRFPITRILTRPHDPGDPKDTTRRAMVVVHQDWIYDEIAGNKSEFRVDEDRDYYPFLEFEIFGDLLEDCRNVTVDADSAGPAIIPTGNGTPGGTCRSVFRVTPKPAEPRSPRIA
jgi:hypothetical protein